MKIKIFTFTMPLFDISVLCEIEDICAFLKRAFALQCLGTCGRSDPFEEPEYVEGIFDECGDEITLSGRYYTFATHVVLEAK